MPDYAEQFSHEISHAGLKTQPTPTTNQPMPTPEPKHWYQSKTIWFNLIISAMTLATAATPSLEAMMTPEVYGVLASGVAFINAILRLVTGKPIKGSTHG